LYYFTQDAEVKNVLGTARATLIEYIISIDEEVKVVLVRLYKTAEGFWYDPDENDKSSNSIKFAIKAAIDVKESELKK
jgi:phosphoribosylaminoimidazole carboxylase (NCAIR synthetase)